METAVLDWVSVLALVSFKLSLVLPLFLGFSSAGVIVGWRPR